MLNLKKRIRPDVRQEIRESLRWLRNYSWLLGIWMLVLSVECIRNYATESNVSINLMSSGVITALPPVMAFITLAVTVLTVSIFMPILISFLPISKGDPALISGIGLTNAIWQYVAVALVSAFPVSLAVLLLRLTPWLHFESSPIWMQILMGFFVLLFVCLLIYLSSMIQLGKVFASHWLSAVLAIYLQFFITWIIFKFFASWLKSLPDAGKDIPLFWVFIVAIIVGVFQFLVAIFIATARNRDRFKFSLCVEMFVLSVVCFYPPTANVMVTYAIQPTLSGGLNCARLEWSSLVAESERGILSDKADSPFSKPLKLLWEADGVMQVRLLKHEETSPVPTASRTAIVSCDNTISYDRNCVRLEWSSLAGNERETLSDKADSQFSKPLKILGESNRTMQIQLLEPEEVFFVPTVSRSAIVRCDSTMPNPSKP